VAPRVLHVSADEVPASSALHILIDDIRSQADAFIFLCGGASLMSAQAKHELFGLFEALTMVSGEGMRFAVGDGGTRAGIMEASGLARQASGGAFPLIGVVPALEIPRTPLDPHHSHVVAIRNDAWVEARRTAGWTPDEGYWGSETAAMYRLFAALAAGRASVTIVANGGDIVLDEVRANVEAGRPMIIIAGSGRLADLLVSLVSPVSNEPAPVDDEESGRWRTRVEELGLLRRRELYHLFDLHAGPRALATLLRTLLWP
jgi:hypothetical protein